MTWPRGQVLQPWGQVEPSDLALVSSDLQLGPSDLQIGPGDLEIGPSGGFPGLCCISSHDELCLINRPNRLGKNIES